MAKVLVVENEASIREFIRLHLETAGHEAFTAEDAIAGLRLTTSIRPDLIICGTGKPGLDGLKLLAVIRNDPHTAAVPVVLVAPREEREALRQAMEQGADDYLVQPLTREALLGAVASRLRRRESLGRTGVAPSTRGKVSANNSTPATVALRTRGSRLAVVPPAPVAPAVATVAAPVAAAKPISAESLMTSTTLFNERTVARQVQAAQTPGAQEARFGTVLFADIRNFSALSEALTTEELAELLHAYFVRVCEPVLQYGGWIVKIVGDGLLAMFEPSPRRSAEPGERALKAALFIVVVAQHFGDWLKQRFADRQLPEFAVGVGVHTGEVMVVRINTGASVDTTIIGDTVNVASRLEGQTKKLGASLITSIETLRSAGARFVPGKRGSLLVKGRAAPVEMIEITGLRPRQNATGEALRTYDLIREALTRNSNVVAHNREQELAETHRLRNGSAPAPLRPADTPVRIPGYRLIRSLGSGGLSRVFLAEDESSGAPRVLKVLNITDGSFDLLQRFVREHQLISQINHPHIATIYGHGQSDAHAYIVMEYFPAGDLRQWLQRGLTPKESLEYLRQSIEALTAIHQRGIVHRDLKPDNFMLRDDGTLVLAEFGVIKDFSTGVLQSRHGEVFGTPYYLSPEQAMGQRVDQRSDLYSLGVMFHEMLTGTRPYSGDDAAALINQHVNAAVPDLPEHLFRLQPLLERLMGKLPEDRFDSSQHALDTIRSLIQRGFLDDAPTIREAVPLRHLGPASKASAS